MSELSKRILEGLLVPTLVTITEIGQLANEVERLENFVLHYEGHIVTQSQFNQLLGQRDTAWQRIDILKRENKEISETLFQALEMMKTELENGCDCEDARACQCGYRKWVRFIDEAGKLII